MVMIRKIRFNPILGCFEERWSTDRAWYWNADAILMTKADQLQDILEEHQRHWMHFPIKFTQYRQPR